MDTATKKRTIKHIIETTFELLETNYFDGISVQQICDSAEINRSTFYRYFEDKNDLLYHLIQFMADMFIESSKNNDDILSYNVIYNMHIHKRKMRHLVASSKQEAVYKDFKNNISRLMLENAEIKDDEITRRILDSKYPKLLCDLYSSALTELLRQWLENKYDISPKELVDFIENEFIGC